MTVAEIEARWANVGKYSINLCTEKDADEKTKDIADAVAAAPADIHFLISENKHIARKNEELTAQLHAESEENCRLRREISELRRGEGRAE